MKRLLMTDADCWQEYLVATRCYRGPSYEEIESWAWARLQKRLKPPIRKPAERKVAA